MPDTRPTFHQQLAAVKTDVARLAAMVTDVIPRGTHVLLNGDLEGAKALIEHDDDLDRLTLEIEEQCYALLVLQQPMATDLRIILAALRVASDIERIGDLAANIAKRSMALNLSPPLPHTRGLDALGRMAARQVRDVLDAYVQRDGETALRVRASDAELDTLYTGLFRELLTYMMEDARAITPCTHLLFMAKNLERIGDHATNIAENVWFLIHGEELMPPRDKRDETSTTGAV